MDEQERRLLQEAMDLARSSMATAAEVVSALNRFCQLLSESAGRGDGAKLQHLSLINPTPEPKGQYVSDFTRRQVSENGNYCKETVTDLVRKEWDEAFPDWYAAYPRKIARKAAFRAWRGLYRKGKSREWHQTQFQDLMELLELRKGRDWLGRDSGTLPYPATFLNGEDAADGLREAGAAQAGV